MAKTLVGALALAALPSALAFRDTSPFFLFSTAKLNIPSTDTSIAQESHVTEAVLQALEHCPTKSYLIVDQPGVAANDYVDRLSSPSMSQYMSGKDPHIKTTLTIPEIVGQIDSTVVANYLRKTCRVETPITTLKAPAANPDSRKLDLLTSDDSLLSLLSTAGSNYTVIYITTPPTAQTLAQQLAEEHPPYEMDHPFSDSVQMELKRDLSSHVQRAANASDNAGLFERYQYFTPGLFMGFAAIIPLFLILLVGVRALLSLEVSYFAFSKEMGPNAQKKQQ